MSDLKHEPQMQPSLVHTSPSRAVRQRAAASTVHHTRQTCAGTTFAQLLHRLMRVANSAHMPATAGGLRCIMLHGILVPTCAYQSCTACARLLYPKPSPSATPCVPLTANWQVAAQAFADAASFSSHARAGAWGRGVAVCSSRDRTAVRAGELRVACSAEKLSLHWNPSVRYPASDVGPSNI
jgi:hypothetical protein